MPISKRRLAACLMLSLMLPMIYGCASAGDVWCQTNEPRRPTEAEYAGMDRISKEQMQNHNQYGTRRFGWRP